MPHYRINSGDRVRLLYVNKEISCNLDGLCRVPCQVNFIGGGKDNSAKRMPSQHSELKRMGVDADIFFDKDENHYILVNKREEIQEFLRRRLGRG